MADAFYYYFLNKTVRRMYDDEAIYYGIPIHLVVMLMYGRIVYCKA